MTREQQTPTVEQIQAAAIVLWEKGNERLGVQRDREIIGMYIDEAEAALLAAFAVSAVPPEGDGERVERVAKVIYEAERASVLNPSSLLDWDELTTRDDRVYGARDLGNPDRYRSMARAVLAALPPPPVPPEPTEGGGVALIAAERGRQVEAEGWAPDHDDGHDEDELVHAALLYLTPPDRRRRIDGALDRRAWPWEWASFKTGDRQRDLVKAGALIAAEIDRLHRAAAAHTTDPEEETNG